MISPRIRLLLAAALFFGWLGYLGYAALNKSHEPRVSIAAIAAAKTLVVVDLTSGPGGKPVTHVKGETVDGKPFEANITNLAEAHGYVQPGKYLLLLGPDGDDYAVVGSPSSPGYSAHRDSPTIYPWNRDVQAQVQKLRR